MNESSEKLSPLLEKMHDERDDLEKYCDDFRDFLTGKTDHPPDLAALPEEMRLIAEHMEKVIIYQIQPHTPDF